MRLNLSKSDFPIDGIFGQLTENAVRQFKVSRGVMPVSEVVDSGTVAALDDEFLFELIDAAAAISAPFKLGKRAAPRIDLTDALATCEFPNGAVIEVAHCLAFPVPLVVWKMWKAALGTEGDFGAPVSNPLKLDGSRHYQEFENTTFIFSTSPDEKKPVFFSILRRHWEASVAGRPQIGLPTGPSKPAGPSGVDILEHDNGFVLAVQGALPVPLPKAPFKIWLDRQNHPGNKGLGAPTALASLSTDGQNPVYRFQNGTLPDSGVGAIT